MIILRPYNPKVIATLTAAFTIILCASLAARRQFVPQGGDVPAYLLAARYNPLADNFDNPSHGWGYPAAIKLLTCSGLDEHRAGIWISAASAGLLVFVGVILGFRYTPTAQAISLLAILSTHPVVLGMGSSAMADTLFAATVSLAVWLLFVRDSSLPTVALAGLLAMFSAFVRGNGIVLVVCAAAGLLLTPSPRRRLGAFLLGVFVCYGVSSCIFWFQGLPLRFLLRSGAGELAFATLDKTDTWLDRCSYEIDYPSYAPLLKRHWRELICAAAKTCYHLYDWWLIPTFPVVCWFIAPGFLLWVRRLSASTLAATLVFLGVQATFLWSGRFQEGRHLLASLPFLSLMATTGILLLPRRVSFRRIPIRGPMTVLLTMSCLVYSALVLGSGGESSPRERAMYEAGRWLRSHAAQSDNLVSTRLNIAYYANVKPMFYTNALGTEDPDREQFAFRVRSSGVRWISWIRGHSEKEFPRLQWLEREEAAPDFLLMYRNEYVSIWKLTPD